MNRVELVKADSINNAAEALLKEKKAVPFAGGTDLMGVLKREIYKEPPETLVSLQSIPGLDYIKEEGGSLKIGSMAKLSAIAEDTMLVEKYPAIAEAARRVATPNIRNMATIGGNICQEVRCWYYRGVDDFFDCMRKGGDICYAMDGQNRYHSIFGGIKMKDSPCEAECPNANAIPAILELMRAGDMKGAAEKMFADNPLSVVTGRVCPHTCETACNRNEVDDAVAIREVERYLGDYILDHAAEFFKKGEAKNKKVAVIGAGPAGLTTAIRLAMDGYAVTVIDQNKEIGGMLTYGIPSYRLDKGIIRKLEDAMKGMGIKFIPEKKLDAGGFADVKKQYDAVFVGVGAWKAAKIGVEGEDAEGVIAAIDYLNAIANGTDQKPGKKVVVIGGGSVAMDAALSARRKGAAYITVVSLEGREEMPAEADEVEQAIEEGIALMNGYGVKDIGVKDGSVCGLTVKECTSVFNEEGKFSPVYDEAITKKLDADMIILATGQKVDYNGIEAEGEGIFVGGDCDLGPATVVKAIDAGKKAAASIRIHLGDVSEAAAAAFGYKLTYTADCTEHSDRYERELAPVDKRNFEEEDTVTASEDAVGRECDRCMNCGCVAVNCSDIAPALIAYDAVIRTNKRDIPAEAFWCANTERSTVLDVDEIVTEIVVDGKGKARSSYQKFSHRETIDFPIVGCAAVKEGDDIRICFNAVYANPYRAVKAEEILKGKTITEELAEKAAEAVMEDAIQLEDNKHKIHLAKVMLKQAVMACV